MNLRKNKNMSENKELSHKQHQAVAELLKPSNKSYEEVAKALGISSRCLYNWRKDPKFQYALDSGLNEIKQRVLNAAEFSVQLESVNSMLEYEAKVLDAIELREAIITIVENQERLRVKLVNLKEELKQLKSHVECKE